MATAPSPRNRLYPSRLGPVLLLLGLLSLAPVASAQVPCNCAPGDLSCQSACPAASKPVVPPEAPRKCPPPGNLDCMPIVPPERQAFCSRDYADWIGRHCPNTHIVY
jgi:hypothetical protein